MKILLVQADRDAGHYNPILSRFFIPSLALEQIAASTPEKHDVYAVNEWYEKVDTDIECDLVAISAFTKDAYRAYKIADEFRERGVKVVLGGYHPTALPGEAKQHADAVVIGEAEGVWQELLEDAERGKLKPFYGWKKVEGKKIPPAKRNVIRHGSLFSAIQVTRGCPYKCEFCQLTGFGDTVHRKRDVKEVVEEIENLPGKIFWFHDASLTIDPRYTKNLLKLMIERKIRKNWIAFGNVAILSRDRELLRLAERAGCVAWMVGLESVSQDTVNEEIGKGGNRIERIPKMVEIIEKEGMEVWASFIFGFDGDTMEIFDTTFEKLNEWGIKVAEFNILTPFPKTIIFEKLRREGRIISTDWSRYDLSHAVFMPKGMETRELEEGVKKLYRKFFSFKRMLKSLYSTRGVKNRIFVLATNLAIRRFADFDREYGMREKYEDIAGYAIHKRESHTL